MEALVGNLDAFLDQPVVIGRMTDRADKSTGWRSQLMVDGGAGWLVSRRTVVDWVQNQSEDLSGCHEMDKLPTEMKFAEDYILSRCMANAGAEFRQHDGFHHTPHDSPMIKLSAYDVKQGKVSLESKRKDRCQKDGE